MRISDWSSDVCSSDLDADSSSLAHGIQKRLEIALALSNHSRLLLLDEPMAGLTGQERSAIDRQSVVSGKSVSVRVDLGGRRIIQKKTEESKQQRNRTDEVIGQTN